MRTTKRTEITIETDRIVVLSRRKVSVVSWCRECNQNVKMITADEAASIAGVTFTNRDLSDAHNRVLAGDFRYVDSKITHNLTNAGTTAGQIIEVELK